MNAMIESKRPAGNRRGVALAAALAIAAGTVAVPALADTVTTTQTVRTYDDGYYPDYYPSSGYYVSGPVYYDNGYAYPPAPAYTYVGPPAPVGATIGVPGVIGLHFGW